MKIAIMCFLFLGGCGYVNSEGLTGAQRLCMHHGGIAKIAPNEAGTSAYCDIYCGDGKHTQYFGGD